MKCTGQQTPREALSALGRSGRSRSWNCRTGARAQRGASCPCSWRTVARPGVAANHRRPTRACSTPHRVGASPPALASPGGAPRFPTPARSPRSTSRYGEHGQRLSAGSGSHLCMHPARDQRTSHVCQYFTDERRSARTTTNVAITATPTAITPRTGEAMFGMNMEATVPSELIPRKNVTP